MATLGFYIFLSVFWICETWMYVKGHDTFLFKHKTDEEKKLRQNELDK